MPRRKVLERNVKGMISSYLMGLPDCYYRMSVPTGFGTSGLDYEGCLLGHYFAIEAKSPDDDADLTPRERETCIKILEAGGKVFIVSTLDGLQAFMRWVVSCYRT